MCTDQQQQQHLPPLVEVLGKNQGEVGDRQQQQQQEDPLLLVVVAVDDRLLLLLPAAAAAAAAVGVGEAAWLVVRLGTLWGNSYNKQ
jgi:hypothetical protein